MLSTVLLHLHKTLFPVYPPGHSRSRMKRTFGHVEYPAAGFLHINNPNPAQHPCVRILAAAFWKESGTIQFHTVKIAFLSVQDSGRCTFTGNDCCLKFRQMTVLIKKFLCHYDYILSGASNPSRSIHVSSTLFASVRSAMYPDFFSVSSSDNILVS